MERIRSKDYATYCATHPSPIEMGIRLMKSKPSLPVEDRSNPSKTIAFSGSEEDLDRFRSFISREVSDSDCWNWIGQVRSTGYPRYWNGVETVAAHRWAYAIRFGEVPATMEIHHKCMNRRCVNPDHLECVTPEQHKAIHRN